MNQAQSNPLSRRQFGRAAFGGASTLLVPRRQDPPAGKKSTVALARSPERKEALLEALAPFREVEFADRDIVLKASFNSPDEAPATTSPQMLEAVVNELRARHCRSIRLVERSGMGHTREIWDRLGITALARRLDLELVALDDLPPDGWQRTELPGSHWSRGVEVPVLLGGAALVEICALKTHRFGGHFSASLKNAIGLIAKYSSDGTRRNYMAELHGSPDQRLMIAEVNTLFRPELVVLDASTIFVDGGPEQGELAFPNVVAAARDRVALDAVGVALLRLHGARTPLDRGSIFELDQIKRAAELGLGAHSFKEMDVSASTEDSRRVAAQVSGILDFEPESK
jgi:uncharacterized protein (DUF362 family)